MLTEPDQAPGAVVGWTRFLDDEAKRLDVAASVMALLLHPDMWVSRRTEEIEFVDGQTVRRHITVCFEVPPVAHGFEIRAGRKALYPPLALLGKGLVRHLVVTNGAGERIPMLNRRDSESIGSTMLRELSRAVLKEDLDETVDGWLDGIATGKPNEAKGLVDILRHTPEGTQAHRLWREQRTHVLIQDLTEKFIFIVPCFDLDEFDEGIVAYAYEEPLTTDSSSRLDATTRLGWRATPIEVKLPSIGLARSCDIDIRVPDDLRIRKAAVIDLRNGREISDDQEPARTAHLYIEGEPRGTVATAGLELYAEAGGFSWSALAAAGLATLTLGSGAIWADAFADAAPASTMLLGIPAILAGYLIRPGEHGLVQRAVWGLRAALALTVAVSVLAILALVAGLGEQGRHIWFGVSAVIAGVAACVVLISLVSALRSARPVRERQTLDSGDIDLTLPAVRFPDAFAQQGVELKAFWTGGPEGFLASIPEPLDIDQTVALLGDMRSRLRRGPAHKNGHGRFGRDREGDGRDSSNTEGTAP